MKSTINYGSLSIGAPPAVVDVVPDADELEAQQWALEALRAEFDMAYPGGRREFIQELWDSPSSTRLEIFGPLFGLNLVGTGRSSATPPVDVTPRQLVDLLADDAVCIRHVKPGPVAEAVRSMYAEEWVRAYWDDILKLNGSAAIDLALKVHEIEAYRSDNSIRAATLDPTAERTTTPMAIEGLVPAGVAAGIIGLKEVGKTATTIDLGSCLATGTPWHGRSVKQGRVLLVELEDPADLILDRIDAWRLDHPDVDPMKAMTVVQLTDFNFVVGRVTETREGNDGELIEHETYHHGHSRNVMDLLKMIREDHFDYVIIDNLDAGRNGSSNMSDSDVGAVIAAMKAIVAAGDGTTLFMVSHTDQKDQHPAGLTRYENQLNTILHVKWSKVSGRSISLAKSKIIDKTTFKPIGFEIVTSSLTNTRTGMPAAVVRSTSADDGVREAIEQALKELDDPSSKNAIVEMAHEMGYKIRKARLLAGITDATEDPDSPVVKVGTKFGLSDD